MGYRTTYTDYGHRPAGAGITWAVHTLLLLTTAIFALQLLLYIPLGGLAGMQRGMLPSPGTIRMLGFSDAFLRGFVWQPFTYMFLHASLMHLFMNMLWLYVFGPDVERLLGTRQFFRFYVFCGAVGVLLSLVPPLFGMQPSLVVGASGAVMGVLIAFAVADPERQLFLFPLPFPINARGLVIIVVAFNLFGAFGDGPSSVSTHFGGMGAGFAYMKLAPFFVRRWPGTRLSQHWFRRRHRPRNSAGNVGDEIDKILKAQEKKWHD